MLCEKCNVKLRCTDTGSQNNITIRRFKCPKCSKIYYSIENMCDVGMGAFKLDEFKSNKYKRRVAE